MLSHDLSNLLQDRALLHHWDLRVQCLLLLQQAQELESALADKLANRVPPPRKTHYPTGYRDLIPAQHLSAPEPVWIDPQAFVIFGD